MQANVKLGRIWGIPIGLHSSWFLIFGLLVWSLATGYFPREFPQLSSLTHTVLGLVTSFLFFGSVLGHELGHAYIALKSKIPVKGITLFIFGGVAQIEREPHSPGVELAVAIAGPVVSGLLAAMFGAIWLLDKQMVLLAAPSIYLMRINFLLAVFNMIPGFPLDGGRVLRAIVWWLTRSYKRANQVASFTGQLVAFGFIGFGLFTIFRGQFFNGLWLAFIGWFLQNAAASTYAQSGLRQTLHGVTVGQVMTSDCPRVPGLISINQLVEDKVLTRGQRCFFVTQDEALMGILTLRDIANIPQSKWRFVTTAQAMVPLRRLVSVSPHTELLTALRTMDSADVAQIPVIDGDELVGVLSREHVVHYLRTKAELGI